MSDPHPQRALLSVFCLLLAAMAVFTEWQVHGPGLILGNLEWAGLAGEPGRSLFSASDRLLVSCGRLAGGAGLSPVWGTVALRFLQNLLILGLALAWWRRLEIAPGRRLIGSLMLAWGLLYAFREGGLDTGVFWTAAWTLAGVVLLDSRRRNLYPLLAFTGAPWSVFSLILPLLPLAGIGERTEGLGPRGRSRFIALLSIPAWLAGAWLLGNPSGRLWPAVTWGHRPGLDLLTFNLAHRLTWVRLIWLSSILLPLALFGLTEWPGRLRRLLAVSLVPAFVALLAFFFPEHRVIVIPLAACLIPGFLLLPAKPGRAVSTLRSVLRSEGFLIVLLALAALYSQVWILGGVNGRYLRESQLERHREVMDGTASSPWRYRVFSEYLVEGSLRLGRAAGLEEPGPVFALFRLFQNLLIFWLAARLFRAWGFAPGQRAIGLVLAGWGMMHAFYNSDLAFSTYTDLALYLLGAVVVAGTRPGWLIPLTIIAAFNRETGVLLPALLIPAAVRGGGSRPRAIFLLALGLFFAIFCTLRFLLLPGADFAEAWGTPGWSRLTNNLSNPLFWRNFFLLANLLPIAGILTVRRWPKQLRELFIALVPAWFFLHLYAAYAEESRIFLVPLILVFVPAALCLLTGEEPAGRSPDRPPVRTEGI